MNADERTLQKAMDLAHPAAYKIHYRIGSKTGICPGQYSEDDAALWLVHLNRVDGPAGYEYWTELVEPELRTNT